MKDAQIYIHQYAPIIYIWYLTEKIVFRNGHVGIFRKFKPVKSNFKCYISYISTYTVIFDN